MKINKKNLLIINNGFLAKDLNGFYTNFEQNNFFSDLSKSYNNVSVLQFYKKISLNENILASKINCNVISEKFEDKNNFQKILSYLKLTFKYLNQINHYDLIYVFYPGHLNFITSIIAYLLNRNYAFYIRGETRFNSYIFKRVLKKAKFLVSNNTILQEKMKNYNDNSNLILSYKNLGNCYPVLKNKTHKKINLNCVNLLFVGRVEKRKGVFELIDACEKLADQNFKFKLNIIGGGDSFEYLSKKIKEKKLTENIFCTGQISSKIEINKYYQMSDIFILPSYTEGFPRVLYNAMEFGLPILTTMVGGIPALMKNEYNCLEINVRSSEDIFNKIIYLSNNLNLFNKLSKNSFNTIQNAFKNKDLNFHIDILNNFFLSKHE